MANNCDKLLGLGIGSVFSPLLHTGDLAHNLCDVPLCAADHSLFRDYGGQSQQAAGGSKKASFGGCIKKLFRNPGNREEANRCNRRLNERYYCRTPGGTSGGEACLLAAGGTPFGIGNDLGGSMRIPSSFCGVVTMKPTESRYLVVNTFNLPGRGRINLSNGFFTKSVGEQVLLWESTLGAPENYINAEPRNVIKVPFKLNKFKETVAKKTLRIGFFTNDGFIKPTPGCERVVQVTVSKLREQGHQLVEFRIPSVERSVSSFLRCLLPDGGISLLKLMNSDLVDPSLEGSASLLRAPIFIRKIAGFFLRNMSPQWSSVFQAYVQTAEDVIRAQADVDNYIKQFTNYYCGLGLDALICPAFPVPAVPHDYACRLSVCVFATALFSLLDYPAGVVPTGKVTAEDDVYLQDESKWPTGNNFFLKSMRAASVNSQGLPLAVQVVTMPYQEEKCLGVMKVIENLWK